MPARCTIRHAAVMLLFLFGSLTGIAEDRPSCRGQEFGAVDLQQAQEVPSPNQRYRVVLGGYNENEESGRGSLRVSEGPKLLSRFTLKHLSAGVWLNWAPDSKAFFLVWSDGGAIGNFHVRVFRIKQNKVVELPTMKTAETEFAAKHYCKTRGNNTFALRWFADSESLLIASSVYDTSDCGKDMGLTMAYLVRTDDGTIITRYSEAETENLVKTCSPFMD